MKTTIAAAAIMLATSVSGHCETTDITGKWRVTDGKVSTNLVFVQNNDMVSLMLVCVKGHDSVAVMLGKTREAGQDKFNDGLLLRNGETEVKVSLAVLPGEDTSVTGSTTLPLVLPLLSGENAIKADYGGGSFNLKGKGLAKAGKEFERKCKKG